MLFDDMREFLISVRQSDDQEISRRILRFAPKHLNSAAKVLFGNIQLGGKSILIVPNNGRWDPESPYFQEARKAASRGVLINRVILIPHRHYMRDRVLYRQWELDIAAGINVEFVIAGQDFQDFPDLFLLPGTFELSVWDNDLTSHIFSHVNSKGGFTHPFVTEWIVSTRQEDIEILNKNWEIIRRFPSVEVSPASILDEFALEEPLIETAPFASKLSEYMCNGSYLGGDSCAWYHGIWQYLRIMDMVSTPTWHSKFYLNELRFPSLTKDKKVLISGTADYSLLSYVLQANKGKPSPEIHVLDSCLTPLNLSKWFASKSGVHIETIHSSLFDIKDTIGYDLIATDAFLTRFSWEEKKAVLLKWKELMNPSGRVVTTARIDQSAIDDLPVKANATQIQEFSSRAYKLASLWQDFVKVEPDLIKNQARLYSENIVSWSFSSESQLRSLFEDAGYFIETLDLVEVKGEMKVSIYAQIVASIKN